MHKFKLYGSSLEYMDEELNRITRQLPIIGDTKSSEVITLAHFSENPSIEKFTKNTMSSWTSNVSNSPLIIEKLIGMFSESYTSIYLIKLGISNLYSSRVNNIDLMSEHAIDLAVNNGEFSILSIEYNEHQGLYIPN
ncbi:MAG: hypothetical protein HRU04_05515 [Oceanospirillaceae bacterium]|nr:hypothetical protein [Oceanospirillaceae bacterium]